MKHRRIIIAIGALLIVTASIWMLSKRKQEIGSSPIPVSKPAPSAPPFTGPVPAVMPKGPYQGLSDSRWPIYWKKREQDRDFEWKTPIEFFGKVVDQNQQPIPGVEIQTSWTDMSAEGTSKRLLVSDQNGLFSITGIRGKHFGVYDLRKEGYEQAKASNRFSFEYAGFWEQTYHIPDPNKPVVFYLRKKGEPAPLLSSEGKFVLTFGTPFSVPMPQTAGGTAASLVKVTVFENDPKTRQWKAQISVEGGGVMPALEEFPFEAPKDGYQSSMDLDQKSPHPLGWQDIDEGGCFYIKTNQGYGLLELRQMKGKQTLHYKVLINSKGGTNLEPAQQ